MTKVEVKVGGLGNVVVKIGDALYTYPLSVLLHFREEYFNMEQER